MENTASNTLFILGAGFTKAANPKAPLNSELLNAINRVNPGKLEEYGKLYDSTDIERILTRIDIDLEASSDTRLRDDRKQIEQQIANYFTRYRFNPQNAIPVWVKPFMCKVLKPNDSIISLNYDCYLEGALDHYAIWSPNGGYPKGHPLADGIPINPNNIKVYKIHGSENFRESVVLGSNQTDIGFVIDEAIYPRSGKYKHIDGGGFESWPYVIAPSFVKIPHVQIAYMMLCLIEIAKEAENLIIIGCGMRREDNFLWLLLTRFLYGHREDLHKRLIILDPNADKLLGRIKSHCAGDIGKLADVVSIPSRMEDGIDKLIAAVAQS